MTNISTIRVFHLRAFLIILEITAFSFLSAPLLASAIESDDSLHEMKASTRGWLESLQSTLKTSTAFMKDWLFHSPLTQNFHGEADLQTLAQSGTEYYEEQIKSLIESPLQSPAIANYLKEMQVLVWQNAITPAIYLKGLEELSQNLPSYKKTLNKIALRFQAALEQRAKDQQKVKENHSFTLTALQALPFHGQEIDSIYTSSLKRTVFKGVIKGLAHAAYKGMHFILHHPIQALTLGLAGQVAATAAFNNKRAIGDEFIINQVTGDYQFNPSLATLIDGNIFVSWLGEQTGYNFYGRLFAANGTALGSEFLINQNTTYVDSSQYSSMVSLMDGTVFATWAGYYNLSGHISGRLFAANGTALGPEFLINQNTTAEQQQHPSLARLGDGNVFVAWNSFWEDNSLNYGNVYGRLFAPNGMALTPEFPIDERNSVSFAFDASATSLMDGNIFVTWLGSDPISGRIFTTNGSPLGPPFPINQKANDAVYRNPSVAGLVDGTAFVVWDFWDLFQSQQQEIYDIYGRLVAANGTALGNEFRINQATNEGQHHPSLASMIDGTVFVAWWSIQNNTNIESIYGRLFSVNGTALGNEFIINQANAGIPTVASLIDGSVFVAWQGNSDIYGRILSPAMLAALESSTTGSAPTAGLSLTASTSSLTSSTGIAATEFGTTSEQKINSSFIIGPVAGVAAIGAAGAGIWKYVTYKNKHAEKERERFPFANKLKEKLQLDIQDFNSKQGRAYVDAVQLLIGKLESYGLNAKPTDPIALEELSDMTADTIRQTLSLTSTRGGKSVTLNATSLEYAVDQIANALQAKIEAKEEKSWQLNMQYSLPVEENTINIEMHSLRGSLSNL